MNGRRISYNHIIAGMIIYVAIVMLCALAVKDANSFSEEENTSESSLQIQTEEIANPAFKASNVKGQTTELLFSANNLNNLNLLVEQSPVEVKSIVNSDTLLVKLDGKDTLVGLLGVRSPKIETESNAVECFADYSYAKLAAYLEGKNVYIILDPNFTEVVDDRLLAYVFNEDGSFINIQMLAEGFSAFYTYENKFEYSKVFSSYEDYARTEKLGLWSASCSCKDRYGEIVINECVDCGIRRKSTINFDCSEQVEEVADNSCTLNCTAPVPQYNLPIVEVQPYTCDCSRTCSMMSSCSEAQFQLNVCGCYMRDGDSDGIACDTDCQ